MSDTYFTHRKQEITVEIPSVTECDKRKAECAGAQWAEQTKEKLEAGLEVWTRLVDTSVETACAQGSAELFGIAIEALEEGKLRDCLLMHACEGTLSELRCDTSSNYIEDTFLKLEHTTPNVDSIRAMCILFGYCCGYANAKQGYPFALLAYLLWWTGKFRSAYEYVEKALERDSNNSLGALLFRVLEAGVIPPWMARKCGSFHINALE